MKYIFGFLFIGSLFATACINNDSNTTGSGSKSKILGESPSDDSFVNEIKYIPVSVIPESVKYNLNEYTKIIGGMKYHIFVSDGVAEAAFSINVTKDSLEVESLKRMINQK